MSGGACAWGAQRGTGGWLRKWIMFVVLCCCSHMVIPRGLALWQKKLLLFVVVCRLLLFVVCCCLFVVVCRLLLFVAVALVGVAILFLLLFLLAVVMLLFLPLLISNQHTRQRCKLFSWPALVAADREVNVHTGRPDDRRETACQRSNQQ